MKTCSSTSQVQGVVCPAGIAENHHSLSSNVHKVFQQHNYLTTPKPLNLDSGIRQMPQRLSVR